MVTEQHNWDDTLSQSHKGVRFFQNTIARILLICALVPILMSAGLIAYFIRPSETPLVLHYNVYFGVDLLGTWWQAYALPLLSLLFFVGHLILAKRFYGHTERIASYLMLLSSGMLSTGLLLASVSIAFINY